MKYSRLKRSGKQSILHQIFNKLQKHNISTAIKYIYASNCMDLFENHLNLNGLGQNQKKKLAQANILYFVSSQILNSLLKFLSLLQAGPDGPEKSEPVQTTNAVPLNFHLLIIMDVLLNGLSIGFINIGCDGSSRRGESREKF